MQSFKLPLIPLTLALTLTLCTGLSAARYQPSSGYGPGPQGPAEGNRMSPPPQQQPQQGGQAQQGQQQMFPESDPMKEIGLRNEVLVEKFGKDFPEMAFFFMGAVNFMEVYIGLCDNQELKPRNFKCGPMIDQARPFIQHRDTMIKNIKEILGDEIDEDALNSAGSLLADHDLKDVSWVITQSPQPNMIFQDSLKMAKEFYQKHKDTELMKK